MNTKSTVSKLRTCLLVWTLGVAATTSAPRVIAQSNEMRVNVPFAFHNGSQLLPAGVYTVSIQPQHVILLLGASKSGLIMANPESGKARDKGKLVFQRYGDQYFLREVWPANSEIGQKCVKTSREREAEIAMRAANQSGSQLALNQQR